MKSFTDLEQSKKLKEILSLENADMCYLKREINNTFIETPIIKPIGGVEKSLCCWSLAALLEIIKKLVGYSLQSLDTHTVFMNCELGDKPYTLETKNYDNPVDACVAMIENLHELKML